MTQTVSFQDLHHTFRSALRGFRRAEAVLGCQNRSFRIGGRHVQVRGAGPDPLATTTAALEHLAVAPDGRADVTVCAWAGSPAVASLPPGVYVTPQGKLLVTVTEDPVSVTAYAARFGLGVAWLEGDPVFHAYASPWRTLLVTALRPFGLVGLHAAAVGNARGGALLTGAGGSGKSTTALACALAGMQFVADDFCLAQPWPTPIAYSLYSSARLSPRSRAWLPMPATADTGREVDGKRLYLLHRASAVRMADRLPIKAVLALRVTDARRSRLRRATRMEAVHALAPTSVHLMGRPPRAAPRVFHDVVDVVRQVRCYQLDLGTDLAAIPDLVSAAIDGEDDHA